MSEFLGLTSWALMALGEGVVPEAHDCTNTRISVHHEDGTIHQACVECGADAGQVMRSGSEWFAGCREGVTIMPAHPVFWEIHAQRIWFADYIREQVVAGGYVSPEVWARLETP